LMWEHDCGCVPVVDSGGHVIGMLTDRDVCMGAYTQGRPLAAIPVITAMSPDVFSCRPEDTVASAERLMWAKQVRRLPVTDDAGRLMGLITLNDIARHAVLAGDAEPSDPLSAEGVAHTLVGVSELPPKAAAAE